MFLFFKGFSKFLKISLKLFQIFFKFLQLVFFEVPLYFSQCFYNPSKNFQKL